MSTRRKSRPLLRAAAMTGALLTGCGSSAGEEPLPGNPKGSHFDEGSQKDGDVLASGTISVEGELPPGEAIFVSIRGESGPPLAAKKLPVGPFPMEFSVTKADLVSMGGPARPVPDSFTVKVALDGDGNPMTKEGLPQHVGTHDKGATDVKVVLTGMLPLPGNPKGSMYDDEMPKPIVAPKVE